MTKQWEAVVGLNAWQKGQKRIYQVDDKFAISHNQVWMPGVYDSFDAAAEAFNCMDEELSSFGKTTITLEMLRSLSPCHY